MDPSRVSIIEAAYNYIRLMVQTEDTKVWLHQRSDLAEFCQDAFDYGVAKLGLDPNQYDPVTFVEQDLVRRYLLLPASPNTVVDAFTHLPDTRGVEGCWPRRGPKRRWV